MYACIWQDERGDYTVTGQKEAIFSLARILFASCDACHLIVRRCDTGERIRDWEE